MGPSSPALVEARRGVPPRLALIIPSVLMIAILCKMPLGPKTGFTHAKAWI